MEMERVTMCSSAKPKLRKQRQLLTALSKEYEQIMIDLKVVWNFEGLIIFSQ